MWKVAVFDFRPAKKLGERLRSAPRRFQSGDLAVDGLLLGDEPGAVSGWQEPDFKSGLG